jgi:hypothetical protein
MFVLFYGTLGGTVIAATTGLIFSIFLTIARRIMHTGQALGRALAVR